MDDYDVVVVGGRVAGAATAMLLARAGLRVVVLDRDRAGSDTLSTHALMRAGVLQLSRWGLLDQVRAEGTPAIRSSTFHYADGGSTRVSVRATPGVDALYAPRRHVLDRLVADAAADAGAEVERRTAVTGLVRDDTGRVRGVRAVRPAGRERVLRAALTVGADGIRSTVAREVEAPVVRRGKAASALLYRYVSGAPDDGYVWAYGDSAAAGLIPTNFGEACVFASTDPARLARLRRSGAEAAFDALIGSAGGGFAEMLHQCVPAGRLHGWGGLPGYVRQPFGPGWALVGDAGYYKDPITTHGISDALRDAELLADRVLLGAGSAAMATYQTVRDRLSTALFSVTEAVAGYDWSPEEVRRLLRRVSSAMSDEMDHLTERTRLDPVAAAAP